MRILYCYSATVLSVSDGDTVRVMLDKGHGTYQNYAIRLIGINAPEMNDPDEAVRARAMQAKELLATLLPVGTECFVVSRKWDKYGGRVDGDIYLTLNGSESINKKMLDSGLCVPIKY